LEKITKENLLHLYKEDCKLRGLTDKSIRSYASEIKIFMIFLDSNKYNIFDINNTVLEDFLKYLRFERNSSQSRIENYFSALSSLYDFLLYKDRVDKNIILSFRRRFLKRYKSDKPPSTRKIISVEEMSLLLNSIVSLRDKTIAVLLAKTGIRRSELEAIELSDINFDEGSILLKFFKKRSNRLVFFDEETSVILKKWLHRRKEIVNDGVTALFISDFGNPICRSGVYNAVVKWTKKAGFYVTSSANMEDHFSTHNYRHWFTTHLRRNGMPRAFIKELRGDRQREAIDIYDHIDRNELRKAYLSAIPQLNLI